MDHITAIAWIRNIKHVAANGDYEGAHSLEDDLFEEFVKWIAQTGTNEQRNVANTVLESKLIDFARECA